MAHRTDFNWPCHRRKRLTAPSFELPSTDPIYSSSIPRCFLHLPSTTSSAVRYPLPDHRYYLLPINHQIDCPPPTPSTSIPLTPGSTTTSIYHHGLEARIRRRLPVIRFHHEGPTYLLCGVPTASSEAITAFDYLSDPQLGPAHHLGYRRPSRDENGDCPQGLVSCCQLNSTEQPTKRIGLADKLSYRGHRGYGPTVHRQLGRDVAPRNFLPRC
jgi:hypothetical protein